MSNTKFTPGPWKAEWTHRIDGSEKLGWYVADKSETELYVTLNGGKNSEANAKLISASPELFEACKTALSYLGPKIKWKEGEEILAVQLEAAIKKATE